MSDGNGNKNNNTPKIGGGPHKQQSQADNSEEQLIIKELIQLAKLRPLGPKQVEKAKMLMATLKMSGYTNKKINYAIKDTWSESTIKLYTRGIVPRPKGVARKSLSNVVASLIDWDLSSEKIITALALKKTIDSLNIELNDIAFVLDEAAKYGIPLRSILIRYYNLAHRTGLTTDKVSELLSLLTTLEDNNVTPKTVDRLILYYKLWPGDKELFMNNLEKMVHDAKEPINSEGKHDGNSYA